MILFFIFCIDADQCHAKMNLVLIIYSLNSQNRQTFTQLPGDGKASIVGFADKSRGQDVKIVSKENDTEAGSLKDKISSGSSHDALKSLCIRFVRLNGILFTRTRYAP